MKRRRKHQEALTASEIVDLLNDDNLTAGAREMLAKSLAAFEAVAAGDCQERAASQPEKQE